MNQIAEIDVPSRKLAFIQAKLGHTTELRQALAELEAVTRKEPGCRQFSFYQSLSSPENFLLVEEFANAAALQEHMRLPHTEAFFQAGLTGSIRVQDLP